MTLGDLIVRNATLHSNRAALIFEGRTYTHREFGDRVFKLGNALIGLGLQPQERLVVIARNCSEYLEAFGAGETVGYIVVNLNIRLSEPEIFAIFKDCEPAALIFAAEFSDLAARLKAECPYLRISICIEGARDGALGYEELVSAAPATRPVFRARPNDIVYLIYTSGSTGRPKGVMWAHAQMLESARIQSHEGHAQTDDVVLVVMPLFHIGAKIQQLTFALLGGTIVLHRVFEAQAVLRAIEAERVTAALFAPTMIQRILDAPDLASYDVSTLRNVHYSSAPMPVPLLRRALAKFGPIFTQIYAMTECQGGTVLKCYEHVPVDNNKRLASAGQPFFGCQIRVVREDGTDCAPYEVGEILLGTTAIMSGYWNNMSATMATVRDGWMYTGDLGYLDGEAFLFIADRKKDMIISGGENIYSWEVEEALRTHPAVAEVAVIGVPDDEWGEAVKAFVVRGAGTPVNAGELIEHCRASIASYKKPKTVEFVDALPRLATGKLDKQKLRSPYWKGRSRQTA
jgi:acyl-CoA synthetase (AMP-forming)/AMP-acid ligase II